MKVYRTLEDFEQGPRTVATIGTFDGVHEGHRVILRRIIEAARDIEGESVLISFHPHPRLVLFPENNPLRLLNSLEEKIAILEELGLDKLMLIPFTRDFSRLSSRAFIRDILVEGIGIKRIVIGYDHHFGKNRTGGIEELTQFAPLYNYEVEEIPAQTIDDAKVSSTKIRTALGEGEVRTAARYLGYNYKLSGKVIHGEKQGRQLGYPTANIELDDPLKLVPVDGVYLARIVAEKVHHFGLVSIGTKPTIGKFDQTIEAYLFDFTGDLYGRTLEIEFLEYRRPQKKFDSLEALIKAMDADKAYGLKRVEELKKGLN